MTVSALSRQSDRQPAKRSQRPAPVRSALRDHAIGTRPEQQSCELQRSEIPSWQADRFTIH
jgi:hypothetical protein